MTEDLTLDSKSGRLNLRVAAWIEAHDKFLVAEFPNGNMSLMGGRIKFGESSQEALQREVLEESGQVLKNFQLMALVENFYQNASNYHELLFIYSCQIEILDNYESEEEFMKLKWISKEEMAQVKPKILLNLIDLKPKDYPLHLVNRD
ncbi:NUDIX domain-containing protein [Streptococcaceae bacterium ESL0687]|nr:NUDIX domain-containing protein [Streptococcaceae bacterium ESL0687]